MERGNLSSHGHTVSPYPNINGVAAGNLIVGTLAGTGIMTGITGVMEGGEVALPLFTLLVYSLGLIVIVNLHESKEDRRYLVTIYSLGFILRVIYAIFLYYALLHTRGEPFLGGGDDEVYETIGYIIFEQWKTGDYLITHRHPGYLYVMGTIHTLGEWLGGYHLLLPRIFNAMIGSLLAPYVFLLARNAINRKVAVIAALIVMIFPFFIHYSALQLRDIIIVFLVVYAIAQITYFERFGQFVFLVKFLLATLVLIYFRTLLGGAIIISTAIMLWALALTSLIGNRGLGYNRKPKHLFLKIVMTILVVFVALKLETVKYAGDGLVWSQFDSTLQESTVSRRVDQLTEIAQSSSLGSVIIQRFPFPTNLIITPLVGVIMPYPPWAGFDEPSILAIIDMTNAFAWTLIMPLAFYGLMQGFKKVYWPLALLVIIPWITNLLVTTSFGFASRYFLPAYPFGLIMAAIGFVHWRYEKNSQVKMYYWSIQLGLLFVYIVAKLLVI